MLHRLTVIVVDILHVWTRRSGLPRTAALCVWELVADVFRTKLETMLSMTAGLQSVQQQRQRRRRGLAIN